MTQSLSVALPRDWQEVLHAELSKPYWQTLQGTLERAEAARTAVYPPRSEIFAALRLTPFATVKAVILGQDPYHGPGQAMGLSFSVPAGERPPPSLRNIFKELSADLGQPLPTHGDLSSWARSGVLLLNAVLTVEAGAAASHAGLGWETLTSAIVTALSQRREHLAFVLWGSHAQRLAPLIDARRHLVLSSAHPSPLSAHRGFFGSRPFSRINAYLQAQGVEPIEWRLPAGPGAGARHRAGASRDTAPPR